jgi:hypothetical protein
MEGRAGPEAREFFHALPERLEQAGALRRTVRVHDVVLREGEVVHGHVLPDRRRGTGRDGARRTLCRGGRHVWGGQPRGRGCIGRLGRWVGRGDPGDVSDAGCLVHGAAVAVSVGRGAAVWVIVGVAGVVRVWDVHAAWGGIVHVSRFH